MIYQNEACPQITVPSALTLVFGVVTFCEVYYVLNGAGPGPLHVGVDVMRKWLLVVAFVVPFAVGCGWSAVVPETFPQCSVDGKCDIGLKCGTYTCTAVSEPCWIPLGCIDDGTDCIHENVCFKDPAACAAGACGVMVKVTRGSFSMGCADDDADCRSTSKPAHTVTFAGDFYIDKTEVTVADYASCAAEGEYNKDGYVTKACDMPDMDAGNCNWEGAEGYPVVCVTWYQADRFCAWNKKRLCSESEWEYAARGDAPGVYPWDVDAVNPTPTCEQTNIISVSVSSDLAGCDGGITMPATPVGDLPDTSPFGAYYMAGNAWEWTADFYRDSYAGAPVDGSVWANPLGGRRVARGGRPDFENPTDVRLDRRFAEFPPFASDSLGFRCCQGCLSDDDCAADSKCDATTKACRLR